MKLPCSLIVDYHLFIECEDDQLLAQLYHCLHPADTVLVIPGVELLELDLLRGCQKDIVTVIAPYDLTNWFRY